MSKEAELEQNMAQFDDYLDRIVTKLIVLLQNGKQMVQEGALTALASVADSSQGEFQKYYEVVMPCLKGILINATDWPNSMLGAKCVECISLVGMAVGKDKFRDDAKQVMDVVSMSLQGFRLARDDPITSYIVQACARICKCLGQDFAPYMKVVMHPLLESAKMDIGFFRISADSDDDLDKSDDDSIERVTLFGMRIGMRTSVLEEKVTACNMLRCYADELQEGFIPWMNHVSSTLVPLLKFYLHGKVRRAAAAAMPKLLNSAKKATVKGQAQGCKDSYLEIHSDYIIRGLFMALHREHDTEIAAAMLESLNECMQLSGAILLGEDHVRSIVNEIKNVITASARRKTQRLERAKAEDFDDVKEELLQEEAIFHQVGKCLCTLIKIFKNSFLPYFDELFVHITPMLGKDKTREERRIAICIFDDVAERCHQEAHKYYGTFLPFLLEASNDEDANLRRAAVYGIGVCAEYGGDVFRPLVGEALTKLNNVIRHPDALNSENLMAYDNSVSALGKICQYHKESINAAQVLPAWLSCLPLKGDLIEAKVAHARLCSMVERSDLELLGSNNQYLPKLLSVFAEVLLSRKELVTEQTFNRMIRLSEGFLQETLPPAVTSLNSHLLQQQTLLQSIISLISPFN